MLRFSHIAAPAIAPVVLGVALCLGTGCASNRHDAIPTAATEISEGTQTVAATAPQNGEVYVYDSTDNKMVYSGNMMRGQTIKVDAEENRVMLDGKIATERDLPNEHRYKIYFEDKQKEREAQNANASNTYNTYSNTGTGQPANYNNAQPSNATIPPSNATVPPSNYNGTATPNGATVTAPNGTVVTTPTHAAPPPPAANNSTTVTPAPGQSVTVQPKQ